MNQGIPVQAIITHNTVPCWLTLQVLGSLRCYRVDADNIWHERSAKIIRIADIIMDRTYVASPKLAGTFCKLQFTKSSS